MSTKVAGKAPVSQKKETPKKGAPAASVSKSEKKPAAKVEAKPAVVEEAPTVDLEEMEENEEAAANASAGGNAAALAAATSGSNEMSASFKNFRHHPDMENFYRFIYENDLRHEALAIIDEIMVEKQQRRLVKATKSQAH